MFRMPTFVLTAVIALAVATSAAAADRIRLAVQRTGTLAWELDVIRTHGLDRKLGLEIDTIELASTEAGKIALKGGSADLMLSDWRQPRLLSLLEHARRGDGSTAIADPGGC